MLEFRVPLVITTTTNRFPVANPRRALLVAYLCILNIVTSIVGLPSIASGFIASHTVPIRCLPRHIPSQQQPEPSITTRNKRKGGRKRKRGCALRAAARNACRAEMSIDRPRIFGGVPDVLFLILSMGDASTIPSLCRLNKATYQTIKSHEMLLCKSFLLLHEINPPLDKILTMDPITGQPSPLSFINLQKFMYRRETALKLASRVARSGWGAWWAIKGAGEMDAEAEMFRQRVERGLYVMFHMADIAHDVERVKLRPYAVAYNIYRVLLLNWLPCVRFETSGINRNWWFPRHVSHICLVLPRKSQQRDVGKQRWRFRQMLDLERRVDLHIALQMLRQFLETIIFAHSPNDAASMSGVNENVDVINWFLLRQGAHSLSRIFLELPGGNCCSVEERARKEEDGGEIPVCNYSEALKEYWDACNGDTSVACKQCETWLRCSSTQSILNDFFGLHALDLGKKWVRQMRGEGELYDT